MASQPLPGFEWVEPGVYEKWALPEELERIWEERTPLLKGKRGEQA